MIRALLEYYEHLLSSGLVKEQFGWAETAVPLILDLDRDGKVISLKSAVYTTKNEKGKDIKVTPREMLPYHPVRSSNIQGFLFSDSVDEGDGEVFDIRNLAGYDDACTPEANLLRAIDSGLLGETNIHEREGGATETHSVEDGADEHTCPVCGAYLSAEDEEIWKDGSLSDVGDGYIYRLHCPKCNADISQVYHLDFCGFVVE